MEVVRESTGIEQPACEFAELHGWMHRKLSYIGRLGAPDRMFVRGGVVMFIEFKRPDGPRRVSQVNEANHLRDHGAEFHFIDSFEDACDLLA